jgi:hypothetical protein
MLCRGDLTQTYGRRNTARIFPYYPTAAWKGPVFQCPQCVWSGISDRMFMGTYNGLMSLSCPSCEKRLAIVGYPTPEEARAAAAAGETAI